MPNAAPLRILHVHTLPVISGSGINTLITMKGSVRHGYQVWLACESTGRLTEEARQSSIQVLLVPSLGREVHPVKDLAAILSLARLMRRYRFDIVHTHNSKAGFVGRLAARLARVPLVIHTVHGFAFHEAESVPRQILFRTFERCAASWCDGLIFISKPLEEWANRESIGRAVPRRIIYSGIDVDAFRMADGSTVRNELGIRPETLLVGIISKLWKGKGHHDLFVAWQKIQNARSGVVRPQLLVVGEGPLETSLRSLASTLGISDTVIFAGFRSNIPEITAALDISVLPSAFEGMGRVVLEAMAAAKPVVASRVGGIPDLVSDGRTGILVAPGDSSALVAAIDSLLNNESLRKKMGQEAAAAMDVQFSADGMIESIHDFYRFVSDASGRPI